MTRARGSGLSLALALLLLAAGVAAQEPEAGDTPDVPPGEGRIAGVVVHPGRPEGVEGVAIVLYALAPGGEAGLRGTTSADDGRFAFENVSNDPGIAYLVGARFAGIPFASRVVFAPGQRERTIEVRVNDSTADASSVEVGEVSIRLDPSCGGLRIFESVELRNPGQKVVDVPAEERSGATAIYRARLPEGAIDFEMPFGEESNAVTRDGDELAFYGPLYPGTQELRWAYNVPLEGASLALTQTLPRGAERFRVLTQPDGAVVAHDALRSEGTVDVEGRPYRAAANDDVAPGTSFELAIEVPQAEPRDSVSITRIGMWLELDDATLVVDERHELAIDGEAPLRGPGGAPLLCIDLPAGAEDLRFAPGALDLGLAPGAGGGLAVHGPLPPGDSILQLRYRLPVEKDGARISRRFEHAFPLLQLFIADTGIVAETERLHRRRPVRSADRFYMELEGFTFDAGESLDLRLRRLPPRAGGSRLAASGFLLLAAGAAFAFLGAPLRGSGASRPEDTEEAIERESVYAALRDLEEDFETGKLSPEDHESMRRELRARAAALMRAERDTTPGPAAPPREPAAAATTCASCSTSLPPDAHFCPGCGQRLGAAERPAPAPAATPAANQGSDG